MKAFVEYVNRVIRDSRGATAIEYALIASLISVSFVLSATSIGNVLRGMFESVAAQFP